MSHSHLEEGLRPGTRWAPGSPIPCECLALLLRPGNADSNMFADYKDVLAAAI